MPIDIRVPIGVMLGLMGLLLAGYGVFGDHSIYVRSLGVNINLIWGNVLVLVGVILIVLGRKGRRQ